ncbi:MAG: glycoside hydrolase family 43 protein, partial [Anaerolineales bacterium]
FPGLPVFHSRDLVHWRQIGHVLDRPEQLNLDGIRPSGGLYAPTIRYQNGTFYVINTLVAGKEHSGNFIVTAQDPSGPWSLPAWLDDAPGIDPSLFFDEDGRVWYVGNMHDFEGREFGGQYPGHCVIWLQELDLKSLQLIGEKTILWDGALKHAVYAEGPHIYKINDLYYLLIAEGGTGHNHAVTIARSENIKGPYEVNPCNPILTHRHLGLDYPIVGTGHGDLVETQYGEWWMVVLAMRPYDGYFYNLGRETFLAPVKWEDDWPVVSPGYGRVLFEYTIPNLPEHPWPTSPACDHFEDYQLAPYWNFLRTPRDKFWSLASRPGYLRLHLRPEALTEQVNPSFIGRRQQHINFTARTAFEFTPQNENESAGLVILQNNRYHLRLECQSGIDGRILQFVKCFNGSETILGSCPVKAGRLYMKIEAEGQSYNFYVTTEIECWIPVAERVDGRILSTEVAGGFVGAYIGMYASANGHQSDNYVDFDWFEYLAETDD